MWYGRVAKQEIRSATLSPTASVLSLKGETKKKKAYAVLPLKGKTKKEKLRPYFSSMDTNLLPR